MKSKTSSFNTTIFKKNLTHHWPIWIVYLCYLIVVVPLSIWLYANNESNYIGNVPLTQKQYYVIGSALAGAGSVIPVFIAAAAAALAVFSYLYNPRNTNMIHSLPLDRRELYITNYVSGFVFLFVPVYWSAWQTRLPVSSICFTGFYTWQAYLFSHMRSLYSWLC